MKFLEDEFKACLSAAGFRGTVKHWLGGYRVDLDDYSVTFPQLALLVERLGTRKVTIHNDFVLEVTW